MAPPNHLPDNFVETSSKRFIVKAHSKSYSLPSCLVRDVCFFWDLKKSFWSVWDIKLVFDRKKHSYTTECDFQIRFHLTEGSNLELNVNDLILNKEKFDIEICQLDRTGKILSPKKILKDSQAVSMRLSDLSYESTDSLILIVGFKCNHVLLA